MFGGAYVNGLHGMWGGGGQGKGLDFIHTLTAFSYGISSKISKLRNRPDI